MPASYCIGLLLLVLCLPAAGLPIQGRVVDAADGRPLEGALILCGPTAALSDAHGSFRLQAPAGPAQLEISHVGYRPVFIDLDGSPVGEVGLELLPVEITPTLVTDENPAYRIMRRAIARQQAQRTRLSTWQALAYTRQTLFLNTDLAASRQSLAELFFDAKLGTSEIVRAQRHTTNLPESLRLFAAGAYQTALDAAQIKLLGQSFIGPLHPESLRHYLFGLNETRIAGEDTLHYISLTPRSLASPSFSGHLVIDAATAGLVQASLIPNRRLAHPNLNSEDGLGLRLYQRFDRLSSDQDSADENSADFWLPIESTYEIEGRLGTNAGSEALNRKGLALGPLSSGFTTPRARLKGYTRLEHHQINGAVDYAFAGDKNLYLATAAPAWENLLDRASKNPPLAEAEALAYHQAPRHTLDPNTNGALLALHQPSEAKPDDTPPALRDDPLAAKSMVNDAFVARFITQSTGMIIDSTGIALTQSIHLPFPARLRRNLTTELWANRVDAFHFGLRLKESRPFKNLGLSGKLGYDIGPGRFFYASGLRRAWGPGGKGHTGLFYRNGTVARYPSALYGMAANSAPFLLSLDDYFDFYRRSGWHLNQGWRFEGWRLNAGLVREEHETQQKNTDFNLVCRFQPQNGRFYGWLCRGRDLDYRPNPPINPGILHAMRFRLESETNTWRQAALGVEWANPALGGDFSFTRAEAAVQWRFVDYRDGLALPDASRYRFAAGLSLGDTPLQRLGTLDTGIWRYAPFGAFKTPSNRPYEGESHVAFFWQHRWQSGPLAGLGRHFSWARWNTATLLYGAVGRTWLPGRLETIPAYDPRQTRGWHHEVGVGLVLWDVLRLDFTRRLDQPRWSATFNLDAGPP
jgi:hypothetical protein